MMPADPAGGHQMDSWMMWVMIGVGVVLAVALAVSHRMSSGLRCDNPSNRHA